MREWGKIEAREVKQGRDHEGLTKDHKGFLRHLKDLDLFFWRRTAIERL